MVIDQKMYGGKVVMEYDPIKHMYTANGLRIPSVTTIVGVIDKPALIYWAVNETVGYLKDVLQPNTPYNEMQIEAILDDAKSARFRKSQKALNIGSQAHDWVERYIKSKVLKTPEPSIPDYPPVAYAVHSFLEWEAEQSDIEYISSERRLYSFEHMYSGTVDITLRVGGELVVADLKTSKGIYPEYFLQCSAYAKAIEEEDGEKVSSLMVIRIPKDGSPVELQTSPNAEELFEVFKSCLLIWRWKNDWSTESKEWNLEI